MIYKVIKVLEDSDATLTCYIPEFMEDINDERLFEAIVICPGGAYEFTSKREGEPVALALLGEGKASFVLNYTTNKAYPQSLLELSKSVSIIREKAKEWHIDTNKIYAMGFSAGGHLAASLACMWKDPMIQKTLDIRQGMNYINGAILCYPVISSNIEIGHQESFDNLLKGNNEFRQYLSLEHRVNKDTPPIFIWHTYTDILVDVRNSLVFASACKKYNVNCELHIFPRGRHGFSLCDERTNKKEYKTDEYIGHWFNLCMKWLKIQ